MDIWQKNRKKKENIEKKCIFALWLKTCAPKRRGIMRRWSMYIEKHFYIHSRDGHTLWRVVPVLSYCIFAKGHTFEI